MTTRHFTIYTDGSAWPNDGTGVGSFAFVIKFNDQVIIEQTGIEEPSTNNRMELQAAVAALEYISFKYPPSESVLNTASIVSDSRYLVDGINSWMFNWKKDNWKNGKVKNLDIWLSLDAAVSKFSKVNGNWIKGHSGIKYNEQCDVMAEHARMEYERKKDQQEVDLDAEFAEIVKH